MNALWIVVKNVLYGDIERPRNPETLIYVTRELLKNKPMELFYFKKQNNMRTNFFGQAKGIFPGTPEDPRYGAAFYLEAVQLVNIDGEYTNWIPLTKLYISGYSEVDLLSVGKTVRDWVGTKRKMSDAYCDCLNKVTTITPFKQMVALKIRYLGEPKGVSHVFHYYAPRNP